MKNDLAHLLGFAHIRAPYRTLYSQIPHRTTTVLRIRIIGLSICATVLATACTKAGTPSMAELEKALVPESVAQVITMKNLRRENGVDYPAGAGVPHRYEVQYSATLVPLMALSLKTSATSGSVAAQANAGELRVTGVERGYIADVQLAGQVMKMGDAVFRADSGIGVPVTGVVSFLKTEKGWQSQSVEFRLAQSLVESWSAARSLIGTWQDDGMCLSLEHSGKSTLTLHAQAFYCEEREPPKTIVATLKGTDWIGNDGVLRIKVLSDSTVVVTSNWGLEGQMKQESTFTLKRSH